VRSCDCWLNLVFFDRGSSEIAAAQRPAIDGNYGCLRECLGPSPRLEVVGHADRREADPDALGVRRAEAVKAYLVELGADPRRVTVRSLGARRPLRQGLGEEALEANRRAELHVIEE
jgi:outer membrane protein OmpA-like peptidoglycan-associated protein